NLRRVGWDTDTSAAIDLLFSQAAETTADSRAPLDNRIAAIRLLTLDDFDRVNAALVGLIEPTQPQEIQRAAVAAIGRLTQSESAALLLSHWRTATPAVRSEIVLAMLDARSRLLPLLQAIEN